MKDDYKNKTALITGASSGIGEAFAKELAKRGSDLILLARSESKLNDLSTTLAEEYGVRADMIVSDLSVPGAAKEIYSKCQSEGYEVDLLINNAGFSTFGKFDKVDAEEEARMIQTNAIALVDLCREFIPDMLTREQGEVINIASSAGFQPGPYFSVYSATKAFVISFSEAIWAEYRGTGVHVLTVCPGSTRTNFFPNIHNEKLSQIDFFNKISMSAEKVAQQSLNALEKRNHLLINGWVNKLIANSSRVLPRSMMPLSAVRMLRDAADSG